MDSSPPPGESFLVTALTIGAVHLAKLHASLGAVRSAVTLRPAAPSSPPAPLTVIGPPAICAGLAAVNNQAKTIAAIGCGFGASTGGAAGSLTATTGGAGG